MIEDIILVLLILILSAKIIGAIFSKLGLDSSIGEMLTGIVFGTSVLKLVEPGSIEAFATIGSVLILFVAGMKQQDIEEIYKDRPSIKLGLGLLLITTIILTLFFYLVPKYFGIEFTILQSIVLALAFSIVDIGVPAKVMISKGLIYLPVGRIAIRSAIINIITGLLLFTVATIFFSPDTSTIFVKVLGILAFTAFAVLLVYALSRLSKFVMRMHVDEAELSLAIVLVLGLAYFTDAIGFSNMLGAFLAGVFIAKMPFAETRSFSDKIKSISFGLFIPLFFVWFGLTISLAEVWKHIALGLSIFFVYIAVRFIITYIFMKRSSLKMPALVSSSMLSVDVESLVVLVVAMQLGIFATDTPLTLFAPSVFLSTVLIVFLVAIFSKIEIVKQKGIYALFSRQKKPKKSSRDGTFEK
jgi:Kef-type K+ transport system membrane component KefB